MQVTDIKNTLQTQTEVGFLRKPEVTKKEVIKETANTEDSAPVAPWSPWQKEILLQVIDKLENNKHMDNNHPLSRDVNAPIDSFEEAVIELSFMKSPFFKSQALSAQANIEAKDVVQLFTEA